MKRLVLSALALALIGGSVACKRRSATSGSVVLDDDAGGEAGRASIAACRELVERALKRDPVFVTLAKLGLQNLDEQSALREVAGMILAAAAQGGEDPLTALVKRLGIGDESKYDSEKAAAFTEEFRNGSASCGETSCIELLHEELAKRLNANNGELLVEHLLDANQALSAAGHDETTRSLHWIGALSEAARSMPEGPTRKAAMGIVHILEGLQTLAKIKSSGQPDPKIARQISNAVNEFRGAGNPEAMEEALAPLIAGIGAQLEAYGHRDLATTVVAHLTGGESAKEVALADEQLVGVLAAASSALRSGDVAAASKAFEVTRSRVQKLASETRVSKEVRIEAQKIKEVLERAKIRASETTGRPVIEVPAAKPGEAPKLVRNVSDLLVNFKLQRINPTASPQMQLRETVTTAVRGAAR